MIVIHHKPNCSTSRKVLQMIRDAGFEPLVIDYVREGWTRAQLLGLFAAAGVTELAFQPAGPDIGRELRAMAAALG